MNKRFSNFKSFGAFVGMVMMYFAIFLLSYFIIYSIISNILSTHVSVATPVNDQILNDYASFTSSCSNRGYSEDECLLIWSGR